MAFLKYFLRVRRIDELINRKATGNPDELARKINLSRSVLMEYLREMKELGFPLKYCKHRNTYYYDESVNFKEDKLVRKILSKEDQRKINGGQSLLNFFDLKICNYSSC